MQGSSNTQSIENYPIWSVSSYDPNTSTWQCTRVDYDKNQLFIKLPCSSAELEKYRQVVAANSESWLKDFLANRVPVDNWRKQEKSTPMFDAMVARAKKVRNTVGQFLPNGLRWEYGESWPIQPRSREIFETIIYHDDHCAVVKTKPQEEESKGAAEWVGYLIDSDWQYEGDLKKQPNDFIYHGQGTLYNKSNQEKYEGPFADGLRHGKGTYSYSREGHKYLFEGQFVKGDQQNGDLTVFDKNGKKRFFNSIKLDKNNGTGQMVQWDETEKELSNYRGEVHRGAAGEIIAFGKGELIIPQRATITGTFNEYTDIRDATWTCDAFTYIGAIKDLTFEGEGTFTWRATGKVYRGTFRKNELQYKGKSFAMDAAGLAAYDKETEPPDEEMSHLHVS